MRCFFILCICLIPLISQGQEDTTRVTFLADYKGISDNWEEVSTLSWDIGTKGDKSEMLIFNKGDTVWYTLSSKHDRRAGFYIVGPSSILYEKNFSSTIVSGCFVVKEQSAFVFKVNNKSFLKNSFSFNIKKIHRTPVVLPDVDPSDVPRLVPVLDSLIVKLDTTVYMGATLNVHRPHEFVFPLESPKKYFVRIVKKVEVSVGIFSQGNREKKVSLDCSSPILRGVENGSIVVYIQEVLSDGSLLESLGGMPDPKTQICFPQKTISSGDVLIFRNEDRVVGKNVTIKLIEVSTSRKPAAKDEKK